MIIRRILTLGAIQVREDTTGFKSFRLNKYHPMSYVYLVVMSLIGIFIVGVPTIYQELKESEFFKWRY